MRRRMNLEDTLFNVFNYSALTLVAIATVYPFVWITSASFSHPSSVLGGKVWLLPVQFSTEAYRHILRYNMLWVAYANTIFYVVVGTTLNVALTMMAAYPLSRTWFYGRGIITFIIVFTMFFSGGMIPSYILMRWLGLLDTRWAMILPGAVSAWNLLVARAYLQANIPDELVEAAAVDGASDLQTLVRIVFPRSLPVVAVLTLFYAVGHWNQFFNAIIYLRTRELMPLQVILREIVVSLQMNEVLADVVGQRSLLQETVKYATIIVATAPILCLYPFLQKYFIKGILLGSLKG